MKNKKQTTPIVSLIALIILLCQPLFAAQSTEEYVKLRQALIIKYSHFDSTFAALNAQVKDSEQFSAEHWRWRVDQYLYGQYPQFQSVYDAYTKGKAFSEIYNLPPEQLGPKTLQPETPPTLPQGYFTQNLLGNPHTGSQVVTNNKMVIVYQGELSDPYVASYDFVTHQWDGPYKAGHSTLSKGDRKFDSHGRPIIEQDSKGHFHIVFGGHGGEREDGLNPLSIDTPHAGGRMLHVMSEKPNDISKFIPVDDITPFASYTKSHKMANGDIYFFTRAGTHKSPWLMYKMESGRQTFNKPTVLTWPTPQKSDPIQVDTMYINPERVSDTEIVISYLWHTCNFHEVHDKQNYGRHNAYYIKLDTTTDTFYNVHNEVMPLPITMAASNQKTLAYDSVKAKETSFGTRPLTLEDGTPALAYEARNPGYREWRMAAFKNGNWVHSLPLPGQKRQTLMTSKGENLAGIIKIEPLGKDTETNKGIAIYKDAKNNTVFATVERVIRDKNDWKVNQTMLEVEQGRISMQIVRDDFNNPVGVVLAARKGLAQRLYFWHDGKIRELSA